MKRLAVIGILLASGWGLSPHPGRAGEPECLVLEVRDPAGDQAFPVSSPRDYAGGDVLGARLTVEKVPVPRDPRLSGYYPSFLYVPVKLELDLGGELTGGEVQRNVFVSLPPIYLEYLAVRNSFPTGSGKEKNEQFLINGQRDCSLLTGIDERMDLVVAAFRDTDTYRNCAFDAPFAQREDSFREAREYSINEGTTFYFPRTPTFHWRQVPDVSISSSLVVCELDLGKALGLQIKRLAWK